MAVGHRHGLGVGLGVRGRAVGDGLPEQHDQLAGRGDGAGLGHRGGDLVRGDRAGPEIGPGGHQPGGENADGGGENGYAAFHGL